MNDWQPNFEELIDQHQSMVYSIALRLLGDSGIAEEVAQDVFLELHRNLGRMESAEHVVFWLRQVTVHRATDAQRRGFARYRFIAEELKDEVSSSEPSRASPLGIRIEQLVASLPEAQKTAIVLRYQEDLSPEEIAALLPAPVATVKSNLQRGLKMLRDKAQKHLKEYVRGFAAK